MTVTVGPTYLDISVDPDTTKLVFPDEACGSIRPGSLNHLTKLETIVWGNNMTDLIEPGTVPNGVSLVLRESYGHPVDLSKLGSDVSVFINVLNYDRAPTDRCFNMWGSINEILASNKTACTANHCHKTMFPLSVLNDIKWGCCSHALTKIPKSEPALVSKTEPVLKPEESIGEMQIRINNELLELSRYTDLSTISAFIQTNRAYLLASYREFAVMRRFIERQDLDLCKLIHTELGPVYAFHLQQWIKQGVQTTNLSFFLDLAEALGIRPVATQAKYHTVLYQACSSSTDLELAVRVYGLWPTPDPFQAFAGSCHSWNSEKINYFVQLCKGCKPSEAQHSIILYNAISSGNLYAFRSLVSNIAIDWRSAVYMRMKGMKENTLVMIIKNSTHDKTGALTKELVECLSKPSEGFTRKNITTFADSNFWEQYSEAVAMVCQSGHNDAIRFFMERAEIDSKQAKLYLKAASSEEAIKAILETVAPILTLEQILELAKSIESPAAREHIAAYYKSLADQITAQQ